MTDAAGDGWDVAATMAERQLEDDPVLATERRIGPGLIAFGCGQGLPQAVVQPLRVAQRQVGHHLIVDQQQGRLAASPHATQALQPPTAVLRLLARREPEERAQPFQQRSATAHKAGCAHTNAAAMGRWRLQLEQVIETRHPVDPTLGQPQLQSHLEQGGFGQVAMALLHRVQHLNQGVLSARLQAHQTADVRIQLAMLRCRLMGPMPRGRGCSRGPGQGVQGPGSKGPGSKGLGFKGLGLK